MNKKIAVSVMALTILISGAYFTGQTFAASNDSGDNPMIAKLAERFNLNQDDVASFFEETREEHRAEMQANFESTLNSAVDSGELTSEQKELILAKHEEMRSEANRGENRQNGAQNREERQTEMENKRAELEAWAEENGIDLKYFSQNQKGEEFGMRKGGQGPRVE